MSATDKTLSDMHIALAQQLLKRVQDGTATAADLNCARQFLKDNGIDSTPKGNPHMMELDQEMPFGVTSESDQAN